MGGKIIIQWAPRVKQCLVKHLYELDAQGIYDEELLDEVGWALYARAKSFIDAVKAVNGRARCPSCEAIILHHSTPDEILHCPNCAWELPWRDYFKTIQHKQLSGAQPVIDFFQDFIRQFPKADTSRDKMFLIDQLIHGFHIYFKNADVTRAAAVNLIEGRYHEVVEFLNQLSYGDQSTPGTRETLETWRGKINHSGKLFNDECLLNIK
jgi:hypothetical protein